MFGKKKAVIINKDGSIVEQPTSGSLVKKVLGGVAVLAAGAYIFSQGEQKGYKRGASDMRNVLTMQENQPEDNGEIEEAQGSE